MSERDQLAVYYTGPSQERRMLDGIAEQIEKRQYVNALARLNELQSLVLSRLNDVLKDRT